MGKKNKNEICVKYGSRAGDRYSFVVRINLLNLNESSFMNNIVNCGIEI